MLKKIVITAALALTVSTGAYAETPRRGGTIRFTAPYGSSFANLDIHTSNRAQDEIWAKAIHRSLYSWDATANKPVLDLAKEVKVSSDGLVYTFKLRDDAFFHNGRRMTADDIVWTYTRLMDGAKAYPGARYVRIIKGAIDSIPLEVEEAARIDGCSRIDIVLSIVIPLITPTLAAAAVIAFFHGWNEYVFAQTLISSEALRTASVGLASFVGELSTPIHSVMTVGVIYTLPAVIFYLFAQRYVVAGMTAGSVKG